MLLYEDVEITGPVLRTLQEDSETSLVILWKSITPQNLVVSLKSFFVMCDIEISSPLPVLQS